MKARKNCNPYIENRDTLVSNGDYMSLELIKKNCDCSCRNICITIIDKLNKFNYEDAIKLVNNM